MRTLEQLVVTEDPAWPLVRGWIESAKNPVEVLTPEEDKRGPSLLRLQVTTRSPMGAVVYETGGLLIDHGWLRLLGSGSARLPRSMPDWNETRVSSTTNSAPPFLLVADDVLGGFFAIDGGGITGSPGKVHYFAPDSLDWENLDLSYSDFLTFALSGDVERFYEGSRWLGWREEIADLPGDRALSVYPFLWAKGPPIGERSRRPIPVAELWDLQQDVRRQLRMTGRGDR